MDTKRQLAVAFDMDGVIFDSERLVMDCWTHVGHVNGYEDIEIPIKMCIGTTIDSTTKILSAYYHENFPFKRLLRDVRVRFIDMCENGKVPLKAGAQHILQALKDAGVPLALATSTSTALASEELRDDGLLDYFDKVIGGDVVGKSKPDPDIYLEACRQLGSDPASTFAIEDSKNGIRSAHAAGLRPIMVPDLIAPDDEMEQLTEVILPSLAEAEKYLLAQIEKE